MANTLLSLSMITPMALDVLENELTFTKNVNREYDSSFGKSGAKIGQTLNIRKPTRNTARTTPGVQIEGTQETYVPVTLNNQYGNDASFTSKEMTLDVDYFAERILKPRVAAVANKIDYDGLQLYKDVYQVVGTPGTTPATNLLYLQAGVKLDNSAAPKSDRTAVINPIAQATIIDAGKANFNPPTTLAEQYMTGNMGKALGMKFNMDQNVAVSTIGAYSGTPLINGASQTGSSLITDGWGLSLTAFLAVGDVFTVAGVFAVNPQNRQSTGQLQQFVVTAAPNSDGSGNSTISISPAIVTSGPTQTVTASPADNAAITVYGAASTSTVNNLVFCPDAFVFATAPLYMPTGGVIDAKTVRSKKLNMELRMVQFYEGNTDQIITRLDLLGGWATIRPELACRVVG